MSRFNTWMENRGQTKVLPILTHPNPILEQVSSDIDQVDDRVIELGYNMVATMLAAPGVGLAAPQVGILRRLITIDPALGNDLGPEPIVMVNPAILERGPDLYDEEGCLSLPGVYSYLSRPGRIMVSYINLDGEESNYEADGMVARALAHEIDHLEGDLFWNNMQPLKRLWLKSGYYKRKLF